ncbi:MAG: hypothetical protein ABIJ04_06220, partial [Bacteroidota bacterium]
MKTREILTILFVAVLIFSGCREITVTTQVHRDGSFTRIIRITGDSSSVFKGDLPYPVDSTWERIAVKDTSGDEESKDDYILTYTKTFGSSEELNAEIAQDAGWRERLDRHVTVRRSFGFFYSYLTFREVFQPANPFTSLSYEEYLTPDDLLWLSGQKNIISRSDSIHLHLAEEKALRFIAASVTAELEKILRDGIARLNDPTLPTSDVVRFHDSIYRYVEDWEFDQPEKLIDDLRNWTGNTAVYQLHDLTPGIFERFQQKVSFFENLIDMESYPETVEMPGLIIKTNSQMLKGNQV